MKKECLTSAVSLNSRTSIIEKSFCSKGEDFTAVFAYDKLNNMIEYIGTSYSEMPYYYNRNFVVFVKDDEPEFVFDTRKFVFLEDERAKMHAYSNVLNSGLIDLSETETLEITLDAQNELVRRLTAE